MRCDELTHYNPCPLIYRKSDISDILHQIYQIMPNWMDKQINATIMRYLALIGMADTKTVKFQVYLPEDLRTRFKAKCVVSGTTMNETAVRLIEAWTDKDELPFSISKPTQSQATFKELIRQRYFDLMNSGKLGHQRLKELSFGQKPNSKELQTISQILDMDETVLADSL